MILPIILTIMAGIIFIWIYIGKYNFYKKMVTGMRIRMVANMAC